MTGLDPVAKAREIILATSANRVQIDHILDTLDVTQARYRRRYPDTRPTPNLAIEIENARAIGKSVSDIMRDYSLTDSQYKAAAYGDNVFARPRGTRTLTPEYLLVKNTLIAEPKLAHCRVAEQCGVSRSYVHTVARDQDLLPKGRKKRTTLSPQDMQVINKAIDDGISVAQLANKFDVTSDTIHKRRRQG